MPVKIVTDDNTNGVVPILIELYKGAGKNPQYIYTGVDGIVPKNYDEGQIMDWKTGETLATIGLPGNLPTELKRNYLPANSRIIEISPEIDTECNVFHGLVKRLLGRNVFVDAAMC